MMVAAASACDGGARQHGDGVGNAERKAAAMAARGGDAARNIVGIDGDGAHDALRVRPVHQADGELLAAGQMQRDVAAIVDIGAVERCGAEHGGKNFLGDAAGHRRHRRDEFCRGKRRHRRMHAPRDNALQRTAHRIGRLAQLGQLLAEFIEQAGEAPGRGVIGRANIRLGPLRLHDQIDRAVLQMQPLAVGEKRDLREAFHARRPGICGTERSSALSLSDASGRT